MAKIGDGLPILQTPSQNGKLTIMMMTVNIKCVQFLTFRDYKEDWKKVGNIIPVSILPGVYVKKNYQEVMH